MGGLPEIGSVPKMTVAEIKAIMHTNGVHVPSGKKAVVVEALQEWLRKQVASGGNNTNEVVSTAMPDMQASHPHVDGVDMIDSSMSDASQAEQGVPVPDAPIQQQQDNGDTHGTDISAAQVHSDEGAVAMDTQVHTNVTGHDPHNDVNGDATHDGVSGRGTHVHVESGMIDDSTRVAQSDVSSAVDGDEEPPLGVQMPVHTPTLHTHTKPKSTIKEKSEEGVPVNSVNGSVNISEEPSQSTVDTSTAEAGEAHDADRTNGSEATQSDNTQTATTQPQTQTDTPAHTHLPTQTHAPDTLSNMTSQAQDAPTETQAETQVFVAPLPVPNVSTKPTLSPTLTPTQPQATPATAAAAAPAPAPAAAPAPAPAPAAAPAAAPAPAPAPVAATTQTKKKGKKKKIKQKLHQRLAAAEEELRANKEKVESWREAESASNGGGGHDDLSDITIEYVAESVQDDEFDSVFERFQMQNSSEIEMDKTIDASLGDADEYIARMKRAQEKLDGQAQAGSDDETEGQEKMSKKKLKKLNRLTVAELKQLVQRPDLVEVWDVTSIDPKLLIQLKSYRNTVPVPVHWCQKRKYLQNKRGIEKAPFKLPEFIADTGVGEMREALQEKEEAMGMRGKAREKVRPKRGKMEIDYQKLHDAFFRYQTKPKMSIHGDMYYEAKELETDLKDKKPGDISDELREALGMVVDDESKAEMPVPWLVAMQRYGPPPSYPNLRIRGLNAPIPEGCSFGFHPGGWGKPPVDAEGKPLYGDVFGPQDGEGSGVTHNLDDAVNKAEKWGAIASDSEEEESSEEESEEEDEAEDEMSGTRTETGLDTPSGYSTIAGLETPDIIELRKKKIDEQMDNTEAPSLYTVVPEKAATGQGGNLMGSAHTYDMSGTSGKRKADVLDTAGGEGVELALDPTQLGDEEAIRAAYEKKMKEQEGDNEDFSDMVAEHAARAAKKRKAAKKDDKKDNKKYKEFKF